MVDPKTKDVIKDVVLRDVSFVGTSKVDPKVGYLSPFFFYRCTCVMVDDIFSFIFSHVKVVAFFENDAKLRLIQCNVVRVAKVGKRVIRISVANYETLFSAGDYHSCFQIYINTLYHYDSIPL